MSIAFLKDLPLILYNILLLVLEDEAFAYDFHGHQTTVSSREVHLRKTASAQTFYNL